ncbi:hypothetical protein BXY66_1603 [Shimia isoporae]|uniref:Uncharacterized protein n=1 Tax=Shimia isoporae TaxID=647720 RepID=A0A4R1NWN2_9RHOB|nr:hypothetical protein [Shimia isoporae]TCL09552.1 hypothetical protein BXY66_1603 [Shimia isoporae]
MTTLADHLATSDLSEIRVQAQPVEFAVTIEGLRERLNRGDVRDAAHAQSIIDRSNLRV